MAEKKYKAFNVNNNIRFKLNPKYNFGISNYWTAKYGEKQTIEKLFGEVDEEGYITCQTWEFIKYMAPFVNLGSEPPFETTVYFEEKDLKVEV